MTSSSYSNKTLLDLERTKTFATEANLRKAMAKDGIDQHRFIIVRTPKTNRWTAVVLGFEQVLLGRGWAMIG